MSENGLLATRISPKLAQIGSEQALTAMAVDVTTREKREKLVCGVASLLASKDAAYASAMKKKASENNLQIKGREYDEKSPAFNAKV